METCYVQVSNRELHWEREVSGIVKQKMKDIQKQCMLSETARPTLSQFYSLKIRLSTLLSYIKFVE